MKLFLYTFYQPFSNLLGKGWTKNVRQLYLLVGGQCLRLFYGSGRAEPPSSDNIRYSRALSAQALEPSASVNNYFSIIRKTDIRLR